LLQPELLSGAPSTVVTAAARAQGIIDVARRVLGDPVSRQRYDEAAGLWGSDGGLGQPGDYPAGSGLPAPISPPITRGRKCWAAWGR
jgi:hypothetical protein